MAHTPTDETNNQVRQLAVSGATQDQIADAMGIAGKTLTKHYREILDTAKIKANANVAGWLYQACQGGNVSAQIFWLKTQGRWKGEEEGGANVTINVDSKGASVL